MSIPWRLAGLKHDLALSGSLPTSKFAAPKSYITQVGNPHRSQLGLAIEILRLLSEKPHFRDDLASKLNEYLFEHNQHVEDIPQKVSRTIRQLRNCGFEISSAPNRPYQLVDSNFPVILSEEQRQALAMAAYVLSDMGFTNQASQIVRIGKLDETQLPAHFKVNFSPPVDYSEEQVREVVQKLQERLRKRRRFSIRYQSASRNERTWDCDRSELRLHRGVLYLFAYTPDFSVRHSKIEQNQTFRVDRIVSIQPSSDTPWGILQFPTDLFRYRMSGPLGTYQPRRANEREILREPEKKLVEIEAEEENWFWFRQRLLQYGENVRLLSPQWAVDKVCKELKQAAAQYETI